MHSRRLTIRMLASTKGIQKLCLSTQATRVTLLLIIVVSVRWLAIKMGWPNVKSIFKGLDKIRARGQDRHETYILPQYEHFTFNFNVIGLEKTIRKATELGCWKPVDDLQILFTAGAQPKRRKYVQFQMEQVFGKFFRQSYLSKLKNAAQVWFFSPVMIEQVRSLVDLQSAFYVPLFLSYDSDNPPYTCPIKRNQDSWRGSLQILFQKKYINIEMLHEGRNKRIFIGGEDASSHYMGKEIENLMDSFEVLYFGSLRGSYLNQRENMCNWLPNTGIRLLCAQGIHGIVLEYFVCKAKVILVDSYYPNASLGTHRVDPLIIAGKIIVAHHSNDPFLDLLYNDVVHFVTNKTVYAVLKKVLGDYENVLKEQRQKARRFVTAMRDITPLCYALSKLKM